MTSDSEARLQLVVMNKANQYKGTLVGNETTTVVTFNRAGYIEWLVDDDHWLLPALAEPGAWVRVLFDGVQELSGLVEVLGGTFPAGQTTIHVFDDWLALSYVLAWPKPTAAITAQTQEYRRYTGVSETVAKTAIAEANTRLGLGWTIVPTRGKGTTTRVDTRFHPLADKIVDSLTADKLRLTVARDAAGAVTVDVTEGVTIPKTITLESGLLAGGTWSRSAPTTTRVVVGGAGEGVDRELGQYVDAALETAWGIKREAFKDARNSDAGTDFTPDAVEAFADGAAKASISAVLNESDWFTYRGDAGYKVGDVVSIQIGQLPLPVTDVISQVTIHESASDGLTVVPAVGDIQDSTDKKLIAAVSRLARGVRDQGRR